MEYIWRGVDYGIRNVLTGCVLREAIAYFATHFEGRYVLRIAYCVLAAQCAVHFEVLCVLRIAYYVLAAQLTDRFETLYVLRIAYCVLRIGTS